MNIEHKIEIDFEIFEIFFEGKQLIIKALS
jgi:hypothetical protein